MEELNPLNYRSLLDQQKRICTCRQTGNLENFQKEDYVLIARDNFRERENLSYPGVVPVVLSKRWMTISPWSEICISNTLTKCTEED